ncbi:uncharacterized protein LOC114280268 [Camellia sinensis]|uniref:uncharacterized protein LOC114280268 n=1 Tax=Camellia sinensis TaxID=4442 RepID=UPI0010365C0A|nr:uncharacterized protein LOC114280268 [Camellia sinensis]
MDEIIEIASNDDAKHKVIQLGLIEIKDRVRQVEAGCASNLPPSTSGVPPSTSTVQPSNTSPKTQAGRSSTNASMTRKVLSPMVARRRGRPCTKRKVSKVDEIVNRLKGKNKRASKVQGRKLNFASMDGMQASPYIDGTQESMYVPAQGSPMQMVDNIESGSVSHSRMVTNISSESGPIASQFIELNIDVDPNAPFYF